MPDIRHRLLINTPPEKVYDAITTQEGLSAWWTPNATATAYVDSVARFPFGDNYFKEMKIVALQQPAYIEWLCVSGTEEWIGTTLSFSIEVVDKASLPGNHPEMNGQLEQQHDDFYGTLLTFHHDNWKAHTPMLAECSYTWAMFLKSLKLLCETGKGTPWPQQHR